MIGSSGKHYWTNPTSGHNDRTICGERETGYNLLYVTTDIWEVTCKRCKDTINRIVKESIA